MKKIISASILIMVINLISCVTNYTYVQLNDIEKEFILNSSPNFKGYYYQGSDSNFHYFVSKWEFTKDRYFKLNKCNLLIHKPFKFKSNELQVDLQRTKEVFASKKQILTVTK
jgi:hypothetical protein